MIISASRQYYCYYYYFSCNSHSLNLTIFTNNKFSDMRKRVLNFQYQMSYNNNHCIIMLKTQEILVFVDF